MNCYKVYEHPLKLDGRNVSVTPSMTNQWLYADTCPLMLDIHKVRVIGSCECTNYDQVFGMLASVHDTILTLGGVSVDGQSII